MGKKREEVIVGGDPDTTTAADTSIPATNGDAPSTSTPQKRQALVPNNGNATPGTSGRGDAGGDSDDDDFLLVKKHNALDVELAAPETLVGAAREDENPKKKKRKKMKINPGKGSGTRVLFDEEGNARDPLEALAADELGDR